MKTPTYDHAKALKIRDKTAKFAKKLCQVLHDKLSTDDIIILSVKNNFSVSVLRYFISQQGNYLD